METCGESNWPMMAGLKEKTSDVEGGRATQTVWLDMINKKSQEALESPAMSHPDSRLVIMECGGDGPAVDGKVWGQSRDHSIFGKAVIVTVSSHKNQISHKYANSHAST